MGKDVMVALDFPSGEKALAFLDLFAKEERKPYVKVGMELFYSEGPEIVRKIKERGHQIFLDLKLIFMTPKILFMKEKTEGVAEGQLTAVQQTEDLSGELKL